MNAREVIKALDSFDYYELKKLEKELDNGSFRRRLEKNIKKFEDGKKICVTCGSSLNDKKFSLVIEYRGMKKTAEFCAIDCLEYFLAKMKKVVKID
ncbi:hypothetical protein DRJ17_03805 [Candidatus Woesearchaeota archaeon]|nr:MAG: hypothetical protein DRJ17_03805 [Candidatus Woesearchaeota archaeon]